MPDIHEKVLTQLMLCACQSEEENCQRSTGFCVTKHELRIRHH